MLVHQRDYTKTEGIVKVILGSLLVDVGKKCQQGMNVWIECLGTLPAAQQMYLLPDHTVREPSTEECLS